MIITRDGPPGSFSYRGDVTDGGVLSLRFGPDVDLRTSSTVREDIWLFVAHEAAHLWNSHLARADDTHPFLHEGAAEYAALRAAVGTGVLSPESLRARLSARLTECRRQVGVRDSLRQRMARGGAVYDCGTVLQWLADLDSTPERGGYDRTWRSLVATSVQRRAPYSLQQFRAAQPPGSLATDWFDLPADRRWDVFDERLRSRGVAWEDVPSSQEYVVAALLHLGRQVCARGASVGFALIAGRLRFDQEPQCGPIAEGPAILALEDVDPLTDGATLFARVEERCRSHQPVRLRTDSSDRMIPLPCAVTPPRPVAYRLTRLPPVATPSSRAPQSAQNFPLTSTAGLRLHNVTATPVSYAGRRGVRLEVEATARDAIAGLPVEQQQLERLAVVDGTDFGDGVIELEVAGAPAPDASGGARGFVGLAFRVQPDRRTYDAFYLRPTNGRADDQVRRNHSVQYIAHPDWPWERLRRESPERYESYVDLVPGVWTRMRIEVRGDTARLFVHGRLQPTLIIKDVKSGTTARGALALWIGPGTVAHFRKLRVRRAAQAGG